MSYTSAYTVRVYTRKDIFSSDESSNIYFRSQTLLRQIMSSLNLVSLMGIMLWGFVNLFWHIPIILFFILSFLIGIIFGKSRLTLFYRIQPILDTLSFCSLIYLWIN
jgi:ABC-type polysaccharide/polyol phosphate export permease